MSLIHKITDNVCFANPIKHPSYPTEWLVTTPSGQGVVGSGGGGGGYGGGNNQGPGQGNNRDSNCSQHNQGGCNNGGGGGTRRQQQRQPWVDDRHPQIITMMADYVTARGLRVKLNDILDAFDKRITDLPTIPEYVANGRPFVC